MFLILLLLASSTCANSYNKIRPKIWSELYPDGGLTLYCNEPFQGVGKTYKRTAGLQLEHVYPASWMADYLGCGSRKQCRKMSDTFNVMEADPHNLWPSMAQYNYMRSNYRFGEVQGERWRFSGCDFELGQGVGGKPLIEPAVAARGLIARVMLYMRDTYGLPINEGLMLHWHQEYQITEEEKRRNREIKRIWGKKNRWIEP